MLIFSLRLDCVVIRLRSWVVSGVELFCKVGRLSFCWIVLCRCWLKDGPFVEMGMCGRITCLDFRFT